MFLKDKVEKIVSIGGRISDVPWQHLIKSVETHRHTYLFDLKDDNQIVILKRVYRLLNDHAIEGEVIEVRGEIKNSNKIDDATYVEYHNLLIDGNVENKDISLFRNID